MTPPQASPADPVRQDPGRWSRDDRVRAHADFSDPFHPPFSQRQYAREHALPRATLGDWLRQPDPEGVEPQVVAFLRGPAGERWLRRHVLALLLVFHHNNPCGLRPSGLFLRLVGLDAFVACSYGALSELDQARQQQLTDFARQERRRLADAMRQRRQGPCGPGQTKAIVACPDEHFHGPTPCLVAIAPVSNFLLVETYRDRRDADTWTEALQQATGDLPVRIVLLTSDQASGLLGCAEHGLQVPHAPDLFHQQRQLTRPVLLPLTHAIQPADKQVQKAQRHTERLAQAHDDCLPPHERGGVFDLDWLGPLVESARQEIEAEGRLGQAQQRHEQAVAAVRDLGDAYHPFDRHTGAPLTAEQVRSRLHEPVERLGEVVEQAGLAEKALEALAQAPGWLAVLVGCVAWFWAAVKRRVQGLELSAAGEEQLYQGLLPGLYWQTQARRAREAKEKQRLAQMGQRLLEQAWQSGGALGQLPPDEREQVERVAQECMGWLCRSSSCVEGRNGRLALFHHGQGRLSEQRLGVLGVVHNYLVRREDGTTAAERFFGVKQRDAFNWLLERLPELPRPAARRPKRRAPPTPAAG
jgi:hypothetical protein